MIGELPTGINATVSQGRVVDEGVVVLPVLVHVGVPEGVHLGVPVEQVGALPSAVQMKVPLAVQLKFDEGGRQVASRVGVVELEDEQYAMHVFNVPSESSGCSRSWGVM